MTMDDTDFLLEYRTLIGEVDGAAADLAELLGNQLRCAPGCCQCCTITSVLAIEAAIIRQAVERLDADVRDKIRRQQQDTPCPFLVDSLCVIYQSRPLICRSHGLPIAYIDYEKETIEVSVCPLNFSADYAFEQEELFFIENFNARLGELNHSYCTAMGLDEKNRVSMITMKD